MFLLPIKIQSQVFCPLLSASTLKLSVESTQPGSTEGNWDRVGEEEGDGDGLDVGLLLGLDDENFEGSLECTLVGLELGDFEGFGEGF